MNNEDLLYIEDANNQKLYYHFTPAAVVSNFVPLVVILDDKSRDEVTNFEYKMWNILTPINNFRSEEFELKDLLQKLIAQVADEYECEDHIYFYGNSREGYGAILHGILCNANAVYIYSPLKQLEEPNDIDAVSDLFNYTDSFPIFYLCADKTLEDDTAYFIETCKKYDIEYHLDFCPESGNNDNHRLKKVLDMFAHVTSKV